MKKLTLSQVSPHQINELIRYVQAYYRYDSLGYNVSVEQAIHELVNDTRLGAAWFIVIDGEVGGYTILTAAFDIEFGGRHGIVTDFYLDESRRGQGIGYRVLGLLEEEALFRGYRAIELSVTKQNDRARRLYLSQRYQALNDRDAFIKRLAHSA